MLQFYHWYCKISMMVATIFLFGLSWLGLAYYDEHLKMSNVNQPMILVLGVEASSGMPTRPCSLLIQQWHLHLAWVPFCFYLCGNSEIIAINRNKQTIGLIYYPLELVQHISDKKHQIQCSHNQFRLIYQGNLIFHYIFHECRCCENLINHIDSCYIMDLLTKFHQHNWILH